MINRRLLPGINSLFYESYSTRVSPSAPIYSVSSLLSCVGEIFSSGFITQNLSSNLSNRAIITPNIQSNIGLISNIRIRGTAEFRPDTHIISSLNLSAAARVEVINQGLNFGGSLLICRASTASIPKYAANLSSLLDCSVNIVPDSVLNASLSSYFDIVGEILGIPVTVANGESYLLSKSRLDSVAKVTNSGVANLNCVISVFPEEILQAISLSSNLTSIVALRSSPEVIAFLEHIGDTWELQIKGKNWNILEDGQSWTITVRPNTWNIKKNSIAMVGN